MKKYALTEEVKLLRLFAYANMILRKLKAEEFKFTDDDWNQLAEEETDEQVSNGTCPIKVVITRKNEELEKHIEKVEKALGESRWLKILKHSQT